MRTVALTVLMAAALTSCEKAPSGHSPVTETEAAKIAEAAEATFTAGDAKRIMAQYSPKAVMIDAADPTPSADRKVQAGWASNFVSMKPADYKVVDRHIQLIGGDAFISSGTETFTVEAGQARPQVSARFTDVFQRGADGKWAIVHEHVSMPPTPAGQPQQ